MSNRKILSAIVVGLALAVIWVLLTGEPTIGNGIFGWLLGIFVWLILPAADAPPGGKALAKRTPNNPLKWLQFAAYFLYTILEANAQMAKAVLKSFGSLDHLKPAIIAIPLEVKRASEITLLANWITLTPGTLTLDVTPEGDRLFVHTYNLGESPEAFIAEIKKLERQVQELFS